MDQTILLTGGIGSGKSAVRHILEGMGIPCYDADSAVKSFYIPQPEADSSSQSEDCNISFDGSLPRGIAPGQRPFLLPALEKTLGVSLRDSAGDFDKSALSALIFSDPGAMAKVEAIVFPALAQDFARWKGASASLVVFESATALDKPEFPRIWDRCIWVDAPEELRIQRVMSRDNCSREAVLRRIHLQPPLEAHPGEIDWVIENDCPIALLRERVESLFKTIVE